MELKCTYDLLKEEEMKLRGRMKSEMMEECCREFDRLIILYEGMHPQVTITERGDAIISAEFIWFQDDEERIFYDLCGKADTFAIRGLGDDGLVFELVFSGIFGPAV